MGRSIDRCKLAGALLAALMISALAQSADAGGKTGSLYVHKYYEASNLESMGAAVAADVYVYQTDGTLVHSGRGNGSWKTGQRIEVPTGEYLVEVGTSRSRHNLQRYVVKPRSVTEVPTGWLAVTSWAPKEQPKSQCLPWDAQLRAYVVDTDGKEHLVITNREKTGQITGRIQLAAGATYRVYWHGLAVDVQVEAGKVMYLPTGVAGPVAGSGARLAASKSDMTGVPNVGLCDDGPTQVLAGSWWLAQVEKIEEYPYEKVVWSQEEVDALDEAPLRPLRADPPPGRWFRGEGSQGMALTPQEHTKLTGYKDGVLKKKRAGGKFNLDSDPF